MKLEKELEIAELNNKYISIRDKLQDVSLCFKKTADISYIKSNIDKSCICVGDVKIEVKNFDAILAILEELETEYYERAKKRLEKILPPLESE